MRRYTQFIIAITLAGSLAACGGPEPTKEKGAGGGSDVTYFFGAKVIPGDGSAIIDDAAFVTQNGKITAMGKRGDVKPPQGAGRMDLSTLIIMPVFVNLNAHPGLVNGPTFGAQNYNHDSVVNDLKRYLYYGIGAVLETGTDKEDISEKVRGEVEDRKVQAAYLYSAGQRMVPKGADPVFKGVVSEVGNESDARGAVDENADKKVNFIVIGEDEGTGAAKMKPEIYKAIIDEAHKKNLKVLADAFALADAKDLVKAGVDGFIQSIRDREVDTEFINALKEKNVFLTPALTAIEAKFVYADNPKWLGEQSMREAYPAELSAYLGDEVFIGKMKRDPNTAKYREQFAVAKKNLKKLADAGVKIGLGSGSGSADTLPGYFEHREMELMVDAGLPVADVLKDATSVSASLIGMSDGGVLAIGKRADFLAFPSNPMDNITNTKDIETMFLKGEKIERLPLIQSIQINVPKISKEERNKEHQEAAADAQAKAEAKLPHYGPFPLDPHSEMAGGAAVPMPLHSTHSKSGNTITVNAKATASEFHDFFKAALEHYGWSAAGNCWQKSIPALKKTNSLCLQASNNSATLTLTQK